MASMDRELSITEAASLKGVCRQAIHAAIRSGRLAARVDLPPGGAAGVWRIRQADLDGWEPIRDPHERGRLGGRPRVHKKRKRKEERDETTE